MYTITVIILLNSSEQNYLTKIMKIDFKLLCEVEYLICCIKWLSFIFSIFFLHSFHYILTCFCSISIRQNFYFNNILKIMLRIKLTSFLISKIITVTKKTLTLHFYLCFPISLFFLCHFSFFILMMDLVSCSRFAAWMYMHLVIASFQEDSTPGAIHYITTQ